MLTFSMPLRRTPRFDPKWLHLRATAVTMATVLGAYGCALLIEQKAGLHVDSIVQCVVIASALGRIQRVLDRTDRLLSCAVLPCAAAGGTELTTLIQRHPQVGDVVFVLAMAGSIWLRRFGLRAARVGTLVTLPLVAVLVVPGGTGAVGGHERTGWAAFIAGRMLWPDHWAWVVLTAFLVSSGARSRADVLVKGVWRTVGASVGTVVAGAVAGSFGPRSDTVVVLIFAVLTVATWLRELSYAYWAGCVTAVLSLLYDWFGQSPGDLLHTRLAAIAVGAAIGVTASWLVLPIRTSSAVGARTATTLAALIELLEADWRDGRAVHLARARFRHRVEQLEVTTAPLRVLASLPLPHALSARRRRHIGALGALRVMAALRRCAGPVGDLTAAITSAPDTLADDPSLGRRREEVAAHALAIRRAIGRRPAPLGAPGPTPPAQAGPPGPEPEAAVAMRTLATIDAQLGVLARVFRQPPVTPASNPAMPTPRFEKRMT
ncbi:FUSC family protein [Streptomyces sp. NPDC056697]|uniref:FUSC family protein n=1 Tax=Streptomyces sp. NPDC056697 TaxID=3345915 RepID=UPI0036775FAA